MLVKKEREEFLIYLKEYYQKTLHDDYDFVNKSTQRYITVSPFHPQPSTSINKTNIILTNYNRFCNIIKLKEMFSYLERTVIVNYDRYYVKAGDFDVCSAILATIARQNQTVALTGMRLEKLLVQLGHVAKVVLPIISTDLQPYLVNDYNRMQARTFLQDFKGDSGGMHGRHSLLEKCRIAEDKNVTKLAVKYKCEVAATQSVLVNLLYTLAVASSSSANEEEVCVPLCVRVVRDEMGGEHKVALLEKPLVSKSLSQRERNEKFYRKALLVSLVKQHPPQQYKQPQNTGGAHSQNDFNSRRSRVQSPSKSNKENKPVQFRVN
jgi:hypothetical protein